MSEIVTSGSLDDEETSVPVGRALARLRRDRGLTGRALGRLTGMSQAKISKIETGAVDATPQDVELIGRALSAPSHVVRRLVEQTEASRNEMADWRLRHGDVAAIQREVERMERGTTVFRLFQPATFGGLLQTTEYARAVLSDVAQGSLEGGDEAQLETVPQAVSARIRRQEVLADPQKRFLFVLPETVLQHLVCRPTDMPAQIQRIREVARQGNVSIKIIPSAVQLAYPPFHGFSLYDDKLVLIDLFNTVLTSRGRSDIRLYLRLFEALDRQAVTAIDDILDTYLARYLDLARQTTSQPGSPAGEAE